MYHKSIFLTLVFFSLFSFLFCLFSFLFLFLFVLLSILQYDSEADDWASFITSLTITLTLLAGFTLMSDDSANPSFDAAVFEVILIALFGTCFALEMGIMIIVDWGLGECMAEKCGGKKEDGDASTKVVPIGHHAITQHHNTMKFAEERRLDKIRQEKMDAAASQAWS
jgi:hypothetical protein